MRLEFSQFNYSFRTQVMILVNVLPFVLSIILLGLFKPIHIVIYYLICLAAIGSFLMGIYIILKIGVVIYFVPSEAFTILKQYANIMIGCGAGLIVILIGIYAFTKWKKWKKKRIIRSRVHSSKQALLPSSFSIKKSSQDKEQSDKHLEVDDFEQDFEENEIYDSQAALNIASIKKGRLYKRSPWYVLIKNALISACLLYFGVLLVPLSTPGTSNWLVSTDQYAGIGYFFLVFGSMIGIHFFLSLIQPGRKFLFKSGRWFGSNIGSIILFFMTLLYIPLTTSIFKIFACSEQACSSGYELVRNYDIPTDLSNLLNLTH